MENESRYDFLASSQAPDNVPGNDEKSSRKQELTTLPSPLPTWAIYLISAIAILGLGGILSAGSHTPNFDEPLPLGYGLLHKSVNLYAFACITMLSYISVICAKREQMDVTAAIMKWISLIMGIIWCFPLLGVLTFTGENASILIISSFCLWYMWFPQMKKKLTRKFIAAEKSLIGDYWDDPGSTTSPDEPYKEFTKIWKRVWKIIGTIGLVFLNYCIIFQ